MNARVVRLEDVCEIRSGGTPLRSKSEFYGGNIPWAKIGDLDRANGAVYETEETITPAGLSAIRGRLFEHGTLLFAIYGSIGKMAFAGRPLATNQAILGLTFRDEKEVVPRYVYHLLLAANARFLADGQGIAQKNLSANYLRSLEIPLPPLDKQRRIAAILDKADSLRRKRKRTIDLTKSLGGAIFIEMFGAANADSKSWPTITVDQAGKVQLGRQRAPKYQTGKFKRPYVRVANVYEDRIDISDVLTMDFDQRDFRDYRLEHGDILLNEGQSTELVGRPAMWRSDIEDCCFQNTLVRFQADRERVLPEFALGLFLKYFRSGEFAKISSKTSSVAHLGAGRFAKMPFPLPPIDLQRNFAERITRVDETANLLMRQSAELDALFSSLQSQAFSGEL